MSKVFNILKSSYQASKKAFFTSQNQPKQEPSEEEPHHLQTFRFQQMRASTTLPIIKRVDRSH